MIELCGTQADDYALLVVLGTSALAGELEVKLTAGYLPTPGDVFEVLTAGSIVGQSASYAGLDFGGDLILVPEYGPDSFVLRAVPKPTTALLLGLGLIALAARRRAV